MIGKIQLIIEAKETETSKNAQKISEKSVKLDEMTNMYCILQKMAYSKSTKTIK